MPEPETPHIPGSRRSWRRSAVGGVTLGLLMVAGVAQGFAAGAEPGIWSGAALALLMSAFVSMYLQFAFLRRKDGLDWKRAFAVAIGAARDPASLPAREAFMAEVQSEQVRSRSAGQPSTLVVVSVDSDTIEEEHGSKVARAAVRQLAGFVVRVSRATDLVGYLGHGQVCALLTDCGRDEAHHFTRRLPASVAVDGRFGRDLTFDVAVRLAEFDPLTGEAIDLDDETGADPATELLLRLRMKPQARSAA